MKETIIQRIDWNDDRAANGYDSIEDKVRDKGFTRQDLENALIDGNNPVVFQKETSAKADDLSGVQGYFFAKKDHGEYLTVVGIKEPDGRVIIQSVRYMRDGNKERYRRMVGGVLI